MVDNQSLYEALQAFSVGASGDVFSFVDRLASENQWSKSYAQRCFVEYKRFIFLAATEGFAVTPSDAIDQVWHLHLSYTKSYWQDMCGGILSKSIHHNPTRGGEDESVKFKQQYQKTLDRYQCVFEQAPPNDIWPSVDERFDGQKHFVRLDKSKMWLIKKPPKAILPLVGASVFLAACTSVEEDGMWFYVKVAVLIYVTYKIIKFFSGSGGSGRGGSGGGCSAGCGSGCGGGCGS